MEANGILLSAFLPCLSRLLRSASSCPEYVDLLVLSTVLAICPESVGIACEAYPESAVAGNEVRRDPTPLYCAALEAFSKVSFTPDNIEVSTIGSNSLSAAPT